MDYLEHLNNIIVFHKEHLNMVFQVLCEAVAKTKIMSAEQVVRDEQGEEVRMCIIHV